MKSIRRLINNDTIGGLFFYTWCHFTTQMVHEPISSCRRVWKVSVTLLTMFSQTLCLSSTERSVTHSPGSEKRPARPPGRVSVGSSRALIFNVLWVVSWAGRAGENQTRRTGSQHKAVLRLIKWNELNFSHRCVLIICQSTYSNIHNPTCVYWKKNISVGPETCSPCDLHFSPKSLWSASTHQAIFSFHPCHGARCHSHTQIPAQSTSG